MNYRDLKNQVSWFLSTLCDIHGVCPPVPLYGCVHLEAKIHIIVQKTPPNWKPSCHLRAEVCLGLTLPSDFSGVCLVNEDSPVQHR